MMAERFYRAVLFQQFTLSLRKFYLKYDQIKLPHTIVIDRVCPPDFLRWSIMVMYNFRYNSVQAN
jgi:hypothetical protein